MPQISTIIPFLRYQDPVAAIDFLKNAFGFSEGVVYRDGDKVAHAELVFGNSVVMIGEAAAETAERLGMKTVREAGGATMGIFAYVEDVDGHFARAKAAGAKVMMEPTDQDYGARDYSVLDPEGNVWSFGNYVAEAGR